MHAKQNIVRRISRGLIELVVVKRLKGRLLVLSSEQATLPSMQQQHFRSYLAADAYSFNFLDILPQTFLLSASVLISERVMVFIGP